ANNLPRRSPFSDLFGDGFEDFFGERGRSMPQMASGSGAIISEDGYIVTNNHVIDGANEIMVRLSNHKSFSAKLIASDPSSDLAILKIEAKGLPFLVYGNSEDVKVGQWVLAIGYPLNLQATVTAGIVSAKGRTLDINRRQSANPVESFIQTDAAVNPGNSGGPLVSTDGRLLGINSAIASPTGSYAGYSFTIPVNIVKKVIADLLKFGTVQRAFIGIEYAPDNISEEMRKERGIGEGEGVYVMKVPEGGAAASSGIKQGDLITKINGVSVYSGADLVGQVATYRPGDKITVSYLRTGKEYSASVTLRNIAGNTDVVKSSVLDKLGATIVTLDPAIAKKIGVKGGVEVKQIGQKGLLSRTRMEDGFVILKVNGKDILTKEQFVSEVEKATGSVKLDGMYPGYDGVFSYPLRLNQE
ncbi:MAG: trypsin-like peptidase domain-containing protein, partial [Chitinophagaceae bacterium]|nr:trypsin-like peptidase domain-containing protein [Chitinophagaceae bacterium]